MLPSNHVHMVKATRHEDDLNQKMNIEPRLNSSPDYMYQYSSIIELYRLTEYDNGNNDIHSLTKY